MRNSPEEDFVSTAIGNAWGGAWISLFVTLVVICVWRYRAETVPFPSRTFGKAPWITLLFISGFWIAVAWPEQVKQKRFGEHRHLLSTARYADALAFLNQHERNSFPAAKRIEPSPYEYNVWNDLPPTIALLTSNTAPWIREMYLDTLSRTFIHEFAGYRSLTNVVIMYAAIEQLPEGAEWLRTNQSALAEQGFGGRYMGRDDDDAVFAVTAQTNIFNTFQRMGMSESNLAKLRN